MIVIACVDNDMGMLFNRRRQSQDSRVREKILRLCAGRKLWMNAYSFRQFEPFAAELGENILVAEDFLVRAGDTDYCLVENVDASAYVDKIEQVVLYRWNRDYPADFYFTVPLSGWRMLYREDFSGTSHEKITEEVYGR